MHNGKTEGAGVRIYPVKAFREVVCTELEGCSQVCIHDMVEVALCSSPPLFPPSLKQNHPLGLWSCHSLSICFEKVKKVKVL